MSTVTAATVEAVLRVRDNNFSVSMNNADKTTKKVEQSVKSLEGRLQRISEIGGKVGGALTAGLTVPLLGLGTAAVQTTLKLDSLKNGLIAVAGSSQEAERQLVRLREIAKLPGLGFPEAIQGSIRLQAAGYSAQQAEKALREFGNAVATVGGGKAELDGISLALGQIASKGKVSAEEINQLNERLPQVRQAMIAAFGTADTEILQKANITANEFLDAMTDVLSRDKRVGDSLKNQFENAQDSINDSLDRIGRAVTPRVAAALNSVAIGVERLTTAFDRLPNYGQDLVVRLGIAALIAGPVLGGLAKVAELMLTIRNLSAGGAIAGAAQGAAGAAAGTAARGAMAGRLGLYGLAGWAAYEGLNAIGQNSINQSDSQIAALSLPNADRINSLQGQIAQKKRIIGQFPVYQGKTNPIVMRHQADIDRMEQEVAVLSREEVKRVARGALGIASPKSVIDGIMNRKGMVIDAKARAAANGKKDGAAEKAQREAERIAELNERIANEIERMIGEKKSKFTGMRIGNEQDYKQLLEDGVRPDLALKWFQLKDQEILKDQREDTKNRAEGLARKFFGALRGAIRGDVAQFQGDLKTQEQNRIERQKGLVAGFAELQTSMAMSNPGLSSPTLGLLKVPAGNAARFASPVATSFNVAAPRLPAGALSAPQMRLMMAANGAARLGGDVAYGGFMDLMQGRNVLGNALERVKGAVFQSIGEEIGRGVERSLRKRLTKVFEDSIGEGVGDRLEKALNGSLKGINASAGAILSGAYSLVSALSRRKQFGIGSILGGIGGFLLGGPAGAMQGYNIGNALDNRDYGGAILGGLSTQVRGPMMGDGTVTNAPADGRAVKRGATVIVQHFGDNYGIEDVEGASQRQGRAIERQLSFNG